MCARRSSQADHGRHEHQHTCHEPGEGSRLIGDTEPSRDQEHDRNPAYEVRIEQPTAKVSGRSRDSHDPNGLSRRAAGLVPAAPGVGLGAGIGCASGILLHPEMRRGVPWPGAARQGTSSGSREGGAPAAVLRWQGAAFLSALQGCATRVQYDRRGHQLTQTGDAPRRRDALPWSGAARPGPS